MELRCVYESEGAKNIETATDLDHKESEVEALGAAIGNGRKNGGPKGNGHSVLNSVSKIVSQIKKPPHRRSGSPLNWFPRKKTDSYLKRKIRLLQENEGMNSSLDEILGNANPHYTRIAREKIAAREAARKAMEARKSAMVEASWCRILRAARIHSKEAEAKLEKGEKCAAEAFEAARAKGVMMYDRPDSPRRQCEIESYSSIGGRSTHTVTASFETAFEVDKEVMAAIKKAFIQLANCPPSSNKVDFKDLLRKISQNPDNSETGPELSELSSDSELGSGADAVDVQGTQKKQNKFNCRQLPSDRDKSSAKSFTELVNAMLERIKDLKEDELASLATIVATCGLNAALLELEHSKDHEQGTTGWRRNSSAPRFMDGCLNTKELVREVPSLDKFLVKHVSRLEREVEEARNSRCRQTPGASEVLDAASKHTLSEPISDLGSILVKHVSRLEKEIQEARKSHKNNLLIGRGETAVLSGSILLEKDCKESRNLPGPSENMQETGMQVHRIDSSYQYKENIDSNTLMSSSVTSENHQARQLEEITNGATFSAEVSLEQDHMKRSPVKHISRLERAKLEVLNSFSSQEESSLDKILIKPVHRLEREKMQALKQGTVYAIERDHQKNGANITVSESLDKILVKHVSRLEKERMVCEAEYGPTSTVRRRDHQLEKMESLDEILVKHQPKLEKAKLVASQQPVYDIIKPRKHGNGVLCSDSLDKILVRHQSELEKAKLAASQHPVYDIIKPRKRETEVAASDGLDKILVRHQPELENTKLMTTAKQSENYIKHSNARKEARERKLKEAWGGLSLGNSIRPHLSRLEQDRAAWKRAEDAERMLAREARKVV